MVIKVLLGLNGLFIASQWRSLSNVTPSHSQISPRIQNTAISQCSQHFPYKLFAFECKWRCRQVCLGIRRWHTQPKSWKKEKGNRVAWNMHDPIKPVMLSCLVDRHGCCMLPQITKLISMRSYQMKTCR